MPKPKATPAFFFCAYGLEKTKQIGVNLDNARDCIKQYPNLLTIRACEALNDDLIEDKHKTYYSFDKSFLALRREYYEKEAMYEENH